jgi:NAD(P)-dependent dehydrogenase (short-subunit alcohol dehydrogenase family)
MDLGNSKNITSFAKNIKKKLKSPDLMILNAINKFKRKKFDLIKMSEFELNFRKNILGNFFIIQNFIKLASKNKKISILHISSNVSKKGSWGLSGYGPSKAAIDNLFKCLQHEYKNKIKFKSIFLGAINTSGYRYTNGKRNIHKTSNVEKTRLKVLKYI